MEALLCFMQLHVGGSRLMWMLHVGGASVGERDVNASSALLLAAEFGKLKAVRWLLWEGGASIEEVD
jgi:hypothetical protein